MSTCCPDPFDPVPFWRGNSGPLLLGGGHIDSRRAIALGDDNLNHGNIARWIVIVMSYAYLNYIASWSAMAWTSYGAKELYQLCHLLPVR